MKDIELKVFMHKYSTSIAKNDKVIMGNCFNEFKKIEDSEIQQLIIDSFEHSLNSFAFKVVPKKIKKKFLYEINKLKKNKS